MVMKSIYINNYRFLALEAAILAAFLYTDVNIMCKIRFVLRYTTVVKQKVELNVEATLIIFI